MKINYKLTTVSCFVGIFTQAIITNITAILFIPMMDLYGFNYVDLGVLVGINFVSQVTADITFSGAIDKLGYRKIVLPTTICAFLGLIIFGLAPILFESNVFLGVTVGTIIFAFSSGLLEILMSPIVDAVSHDDNKGTAMSLMHSFYAWGQVATIILTTLFLFVIGNEHWQLVVWFWAIVPFINFFMFLKSPMPKTIPTEHRLDMKDMLFKPFYILALLAIMTGGASEVIMNQWASTFMEKSIQLPKLVGDLFGMCGFAAMLGLGRLLYGIYGAKISMKKVLVLCAGTTVICYLVVALSPISIINVIACAACGIATSLLWPGVIVVSSRKYAMAGAWMFAILAAAGDIGAAVGPWVVGVVVDSSITSSAVEIFSNAYNITAEQGAIRIGILVGAIFPIACLVVNYTLKKKGNELN